MFRLVEDGESIVPLVVNVQSIFKILGFVKDGQSGFVFSLTRTLDTLITLEC